MKLMIYGCVVRSNEKGAAVAIERYEFRTQGSKAFQQPGIPAPVELRFPSNPGFQLGLTSPTTGGLFHF